MAQTAAKNITTRAALVATLTAAAGIAAPHAHADAFVSCEFVTERPFVYNLNGVDYVGGRLDANNCHTNLPVTQLTFALTLTLVGGPGNPVNFANIYTDARDVHDGDSFSVQYPNDDRLIPASSGVLGTKVVVYSVLTGASDPRFQNYQCSTWQFHGDLCPPAVHA